MQERHSSVVFIKQKSSTWLIMWLPRTVSYACISVEIVPNACAPVGDPSFCGGHISGTAPDLPIQLSATVWPALDWPATLLDKLWIWCKKH